MHPKAEVPVTTYVVVVVGLNAMPFVILGFHENVGVPVAVNVTG
jgi:hypothetical protein